MRRNGIMYNRATICLPFRCTDCGLVLYGNLNTYENSALTVYYKTIIIDHKIKWQKILFLIESA